MFVLGEHAKELLEEGHELLGHGIELMDVAVGVDIAEASTNGVVDEEEVGELVPGPLVGHELAVFDNSIRADLHESAVLGTAAGAAIEPNDGSLPIGDVVVLEMPEEQVAVGLWCDFDVAIGKTRVSRQDPTRRKSRSLPSMHLDLGQVLSKSRKIADVVIGG